MIPLKDQEQLKKVFAEALTGPLKIEHFTQRPLSILVPGREECRFCQEVRTLLEELRALSPKLGLRVHELSEARELAARLGVERVPATVLRGQLNRPVSVYGFLSGSLFPSLIQMIIEISRGATELDVRLKRRLQRVRDDVPVRLFVSPGCPFSPGMVQTLTRFAVEHHRIKASVIEAEEFPRLVQMLGIRAVPFTRIGERVSFTGAVPASVLLEQIMRVAEGQTLSAGEGLLGEGERSMTPLAGEPEPRSTRGGLILP